MVRWAGRCGPVTHHWAVAVALSIGVCGDRLAAHLDIAKGAFFGSDDLDFLVPLPGDQDAIAGESRVDRVPDRHFTIKYDFGRRRARPTGDDLPRDLARGFRAWVVAGHKIVTNRNVLMNQLERGSSVGLRTELSTAPGDNV